MSTLCEQSFSGLSLEILLDNHPLATEGLKKTWIEKWDSKVIGCVANRFGNLQ
jgi:hypothetical protein